MANEEKCDQFERRLVRLEETQERRHNSLSGDMKTLAITVSKHIEGSLKRSEMHDKNHEDAMTQIKELNVNLTDSISNTKALVDGLTTARTLGSVGKWITSVAVFGVFFVWIAGKLNG